MKQKEQEGDSTIYDIADQLKISTSTVSRAICNRYGVSKETREKVMKKAKELGYKRNEAAAQLRTRRSLMVGIVIPEMTTTFYVDFINRVQELLDKKGFQVNIAICNEDPKLERKHLLMFERHRAEAIFISACHDKKNKDIYSRLIESGTPLIFFDRIVNELSCTKIRINDYERSCQLIEHLYETGRRNIIHLTGPSFIQNASDRKKAFVDTLKRLNLPVSKDSTIRSGVTFEAGEKSMERFLKKNIPFDAVFCFTEMTALAVKSVLQKHHYSIPDDVAICCISGTRLSTIVHPTITAIEQPVKQMAKICVQQLMKKLSRKKTLDKTFTLDAQMHIRESTEAKK